MTALIVLLCLSECAALYWWCWCRDSAQQAKQEVWWERERIERDKRRVEAIEDGLAAWIDLLELPQLAEQTKRQEAVRQLRIVLVEQLMRGPKIR